ncbi:hypothetical protein B0H14DRAFT_3900141, partial [Mycena olivaceomarginata]
MSANQATMSTAPYTVSDLNGLKKAALVNFVARQADVWPGPDVYSDKSTTVKRLRAVLLDPRYGFTKSMVLCAPSSARSESTSESTLSPPPFTDDDAGRSPIPNPDAGDVKMVYAEWVKLLIEDMRKTSAHGHPKISQDVFLEVSERGEHGEWKTELHEVLYELQKSNAAIEGPTKVLYRDPEDPEYWVVFVKVTDNAPVPLELAETFPRFVTIPATGRLELRVEPAEDTHRNTAPPPSQEPFDVNDPHAKPLEHARRRASAANHPSGADLNADVAWLKAQLENETGYQDFKDNQRKVQMNPGTVASWKFCADFSQKYFGEVSHVQGRKKIQQKSIQKALGLSTSLAEACKATQIPRRYGEGGTSPAKAVMDQVNLKETPPKGAKVLYPFLVAYNKKHTKA